MPAPTFNRFECIGRLTKDLELKYTKTSAEYCNGGIAINGGYFNKKTASWVNHTTFVNFTAWKWIAKKLVDKCSKGDLLFIAGDLGNNQWVDSNGNKRNDLQLNPKEFQIIESSSEDSSSFDFGENKEDAEESLWEKELNES